MKVIKPGRLGVLTRCFEHQRRFYLGVSVFAFVPLTAEPGLLSEIALWKFIADRLGKEAALDAGIPKSRAEVLLDAIAFAPDGASVPAVAVRAQVGPVDKTLHVYGDRYWIGSRASEARPFTQMPLDWEHAFGGPDYARNPLGKGHAEVEIEGARIQPLPNVESPRELVDSPGKRPEPASFRALDIAWPQRTRLAGTHDQAWLEQLFPGFARDIDWGFFNIAAPDQQREGWWRPGEAFRFDNLHPTRAALTGELPRFVARVFVSRSHRIGEPRPTKAAQAEVLRQPPDALEEVPLALQTLWFFPDAERAVMIFQGSTLVAEEDGADVLHLLAAAEHHGRPRPTERYLEALTERLDPEYGALASLREDDLLPEQLGAIAGDEDEDKALSKVEGLIQQNLHRRKMAEFERARAVVAGYGLDPDVHGPPKPEPYDPPPAPEEVPARLAAAKQAAEARKAEIEAQMQAKQAETEQLVDELGIEGFDSEVLRQEQAAKPSGPPTWTCAAQLALLSQIAMDCRAKGTIIDEIEEMLVDEELHAQWTRAEEQMREAYRASAHLQDPAPPMPADQREAARERVRRAVAAGEDFAGLNLTGADLSGMDLAGADLSNAFLDSATLDGADLRGAKLGRAVLAHASLVNTRLDEADLRGANLGKARLEGTVAVGAGLEDAILVEARITGARLAGARLDRAQLRGAELRQTDARSIRGEQLNFLETTVADVDLRGAKLDHANFLQLDLRGVTLEQASLASVTFLKCELSGVSARAAVLDNARFVEACTLDGAVLSEASLVGANLRGTSMKGCDLRRATLDDADLSECDLREAKLYQAVARRARFEIADLSGAELLSANLMGASFARASIYGADLRHSNLHGTDMARVRSDAQVQLEGALLTKVRIHPRHEAVAPEVGGG